MYQIYLIMTTGRTGSDYLNACLDNVKGVMVFSGKFEYHKFYEKFKNLSNNDLIEKFILINKKIFSYDDVELIDTKVNLTDFKNNFLKISPQKIKNRKEFLINIYRTYHLTVGRDLQNAKAIVHHSHGYENTIKCLEDFPNAKLLITIRDPRANLKSGLENWFRYDEAKRNLEHVYLYLKRIKYDLKKIQTYSNPKIFIQLEKMGEKKTKLDICSFLEVDYCEEIETATLNSVPWKGDVLSQNKSKKGEYMENVKNNQWEQYFTKNEIYLLNMIYKDYIQFDYNIKKINFFLRIVILISSLKIFNFEKKFLENSNKKFKNIYSNLKHYFKIRIIILFSFLGL